MINNDASDFRRPAYPNYYYCLRRIPYTKQEHGGFVVLLCLNTLSNKFPSQCTTCRVQWTDLTTIPSVRPGLALINNFRIWHVRLDHDHLIVLLVFIHIPRSPCRWAYDTWCDRTRAVSHDLPRPLPIIRCRFQIRSERFLCAVQA